jgi:hypothetical protein
MPGFLPTFAGQPCICPFGTSSTNNATDGCFPLRILRGLQVVSGGFYTDPEGTDPEGIIVVDSTLGGQTLQFTVNGTFNLANSTTNQTLGYYFVTYGPSSNPMKYSCRQTSIQKLNNSLTIVRCMLSGGAMRDLEFSIMGYSTNTSGFVSVATGQVSLLKIPFFVGSWVNPTCRFGILGLVQLPTACLCFRFTQTLWSTARLLHSTGIHSVLS